MQYPKLPFRTFHFISTSGFSYAKPLDAGCTVSITFSIYGAIRTVQTTRDVVDYYVWQNGLVKDANKEARVDAGKDWLECPLVLDCEIAAFLEDVGLIDEHTIAVCEEEGKVPFPNYFKPVDETLAVMSSDSEEAPVYQRLVWHKYTQDWNQAAL